MKTSAPQPDVQSARSGDGHGAIALDSPSGVAQRETQARIAQSPRAQSASAVQSRVDGSDRVASQRAPNRTGLPDALKSGVEALSGLSLADVRVQYNSARPAQLNALAFTQGRQIHVAPGQERHLPHEAWHLVQQAQGRVAPTTQLKGVGINDSDALEREADEMGARALRGAPEPAALQEAAAPSQPVVQRAIGFEFEFGSWESTHTDGTRLQKGEVISNQGKFKVEGEDADAGVSAVEMVFSPLVTLEEAKTEIAKADALADAVHKGTRTFDGFHIAPGTRTAKMQASPAIPLDKLVAFYKLSSQAFIGRRMSPGHTVQDAIFRKHLGEDAEASDALRGLVALVVDYLIQGMYQGRLNYPKSAFRLMARSSFTKMYSLVPESAFFNDPANAGKWVDLVMETFTSLTQNRATPTDEQIATAADAPAIAAPLHEMENLPDDSGGAQEKYKLKTTRREWLAEMPTRDLLSKATDKRFEGMGAYGDAADRLVDLAVKKSVEVMEESASSEESAPEVEAPKGMAEAPLFEIRGAADMFGLSQDVQIGSWVAKATEIFDKVDEATGGLTYGLGAKPVIAADTDAPDMWEKVVPAPVVAAPAPSAKPWWKLW